jgi:hypothetical protein
VHLNFHLQHYHRSAPLIHCFNMPTTLDTLHGRQRCLCNWAGCGSLSLHFYNLENDDLGRGGLPFSCDLRGDSQFRHHLRAKFAELLDIGDAAILERGVVRINRHHYSPSVLRIFADNRKARNRPVPVSFFKIYLKGILAIEKDSRVSLFSVSRNGQVSNLFAYVPSYKQSYVLRDLKKLRYGTNQREVASLLAHGDNEEHPTANYSWIKHPSLFDYRQDCLAKQHEFIKMNSAITALKRGRKRNLEVITIDSQLKANGLDGTTVHNDEWICRYCTLINNINVHPPPYCRVCVYLRPRFHGSRSMVHSSLILQGENGVEDCGDFPHDNEAFNVSDERRISRYKRLSTGNTKTEYQMTKFVNETIVKDLQKKDLSTNIADFSLWVITPQSWLTRHQVMLSINLQKSNNIQRNVAIIHQIQRNAGQQLSLYHRLDRKHHCCLGPKASVLFAKRLNEGKHNTAIETIQNTQNLEYDPKHPYNPLVYNNLDGMVLEDGKSLQQFFQLQVQNFFAKHLLELIDLLGINQRSVMSLDIGLTSQDAKQWRRSFDGDTALPGFLQKQGKLSPEMKKDMGQILFVLSYEFPRNVFQGENMPKFWRSKPTSWRHATFAHEFAKELCLTAKQQGLFRTEGATLNLWKCVMVADNEGTMRNTYQPLGVHTDYFNDGRTDFDDCESLNITVDVEVLARKIMPAEKFKLLEKKATQCGISLNSVFSTWLVYLRRICGDKDDMRQRGYNAEDPVGSEFLTRLENGINLPMTHDDCLLDVELLSDPTFPSYLESICLADSTKQFKGKFARFRERWRKLWYLSSTVDDIFLLFSKYRHLLTYKDAAEICAFCGWTANGQMLLKPIFDKWRLRNTYLTDKIFESSFLKIGSIYEMFEEELYLYAHNDNQSRIATSKKPRSNLAWVSSDYFRFQQSSPLFFFKENQINQREQARIENGSRLAKWSAILSDLRDNALSTEAAYTQVQQITDVGHFRAMTSIQLASLLGIIPLTSLRFGRTSSEGGFKTFGFLKKHSIEFDQDRHKKASQRMDSAWGNLKNCVAAAGYNLPDLVLEQLCCLFERRETFDKHGIHRPIVRYDLIFQSEDSIWQNFYKANTDYSILQILVKGKWTNLTDYLTAWCQIKGLSNNTYPQFVQNEFPRLPFAKYK